MADSDYTKRCTKCGIEKSSTEFHKDSRGKNGLGSQCKQCRSDYKRTWYKENYDRVRQSNSNWKQNHQGYNAIWRAENPGYHRVWKYNNSGLVNASTAKRRAAVLLATPRWANSKLIELEYELAAWCTKVMGKPYHVDHIVPLQGKIVCGLHVEHNLRVITGSENSSKKNRFEIL